MYSNDLTVQQQLAQEETYRLAFRKLKYNTELNAVNSMEDNCLDYAKLRSELDIYHGWLINLYKRSPFEPGLVLAAGQYALALLNNGVTFAYSKKYKWKKQTRAEQLGSARNTMAAILGGSGYFSEGLTPPSLMAKWRSVIPPHKLKA
jgi:hypothetical protein